MTREHPHTPRLLLGVPLLALVALAACGSDDDDSSDTTAAAVTTAAAETTVAGDATTMPNTTGETIEVVASDYSFGGIPESVPSGTKFTLTNSSDAELHEFVAIRIPESETRSVEELVALPEEEVDAVFGSAEPAAVLLAMPGTGPEANIPAVGDGTVIEPGRYAVVCFIPEGADPQAFMEAAQQSSEGPPEVPGGPPHAALGMYAEFVVEG